MFLADSVICIDGKAPHNLPSALTSLPLVAIDRGLLHILRWKLDSSMVIGDMDSLPPDYLKGIPEEKILRYPEDKDYSDTELGLEFAQKNYGPSVAILGGGGGRMDHIFALFQLLVRPHPPTCWLTDVSWIEVLQKTTLIEVSPPLRVSFFSLGTEPAKLITTGLQWPLTTITPTSGSLSNIITEKNCHIEVVQGKVVMVLPFPSSVQLQRVTQESAEDLPLR